MKRCLEEAAAGRRGGRVSCAASQTRDAQRRPLQRMPGCPLGLGSPASYRISPAVDPCWGLEGRLAEKQPLWQAGGRDRKAAWRRGPRWPGSHLSALLMRRSAASFSASRCSAVTRKPSSGGEGSLRGSPRLCSSRGILRFRGLGLSDVGEQFLQVRFCPLVASASLSGWLLLWETTGAAEGDGRPSSLPFFEDFWGSPCGMAGPLLLCTGGKPRVELYELVMAFLWRQELIKEIWSFFLYLSSALLESRCICRGPGLGTKKETPRGLNADRVPPVPSGPLLRSSFLPVTVGTSSCLAIPFPLSPRALNAVFSVHRLLFGTHLGVVGGTGCPRATLTGTVSTADTELWDIVEL